MVFFQKFYSYDAWQAQITDNNFAGVVGEGGTHCNRSTSNFLFSVFHDDRCTWPARFNRCWRYFMGVSLQSAESLIVRFLQQLRMLVCTGTWSISFGFLFPLLYLVNSLGIIHNTFSFYYYLIWSDVIHDHAEHHVTSKSIFWCIPAFCSSIVTVGVSISVSASNLHHRCDGCGISKSLLVSAWFMHLAHDTV